MGIPFATATRIRWISALLLALCAGGVARAEEDAAEAREERPRCAIPAALLEPGDPRLWQIYDGVRKGLAAAQMPRVCVEPIEDDDDFRALAARLNKEQEAPVAPLVRGPLAFAFGDKASQRMLRMAPSVPRVFALVRYTVKEGGTAESLQPLPTIEGLHAVTYASVPVGWVGSVLQRMLGKEKPRVGVAWKRSPWTGSAVQEARARAIEEAGGFRFVGLDEKPDILLHLRLGVGGELAAFSDTVRTARKLRIPLVSDDPARFGLGAHVILVPDLELVGRAAAEAARRLDRDRSKSLPARAVLANRIWIDLEALDRAKIDLPLSFLASAYKLRRGLGRRAQGGGR